jgi:hypothetical protein
MGRTVRVSRPSMGLARQDLRTHDAGFDVEQHAFDLDAVERHALLGQAALTSA